jgi:hypothetical protein
VLFDMYLTLVGKLRISLSPFCRPGLFVFLFLAVYDLTRSSAFGGLSVTADAVCLPLMRLLFGRLCLLRLAVAVFSLPHLICRFLLWLLV